MPPETLVGGRFLVEGLEREDPLFSTLRARDQKTQRPIAIHVLSANLAGDKDSFDRVRGEIRAAARFKHRSLVGTFGVGTHGGSAHFVACEWVPGRPLSEFLSERRAQGKPLSVRGVYNVIAHVCKALSHLHAESCHGALRPQVVWITRSGRVKVGDVGLSLAMAHSGKWALLPDEEQAYLAPEVKAGAAPDARSDIFSVGALMYVMLTGRSPSDEPVPPSEARRDATPELDAVLVKCLAREPSERYASAQQVMDALLPIAGESPEPEDEEEFGVDLEIDVDIATSLAPRAPSGPVGPVAEPAAERASAPDAQTRLSPPPAPQAPPAAIPRSNGARRPFNPLASAAVHEPGAAPAAAMSSADAASAAAARNAAIPFAATDNAPVAAASSVPEVELSTLMERLTQNDAPRWMAVKDGLDHGPFTARELIKLVVEGEIQEKHVLLNMDDNERKPLAEYEQFAEFVQQYKLRKEEADHLAALDRSQKVERRGNVVKLAIFATAIAVLGGGGAFYVMSRQAAKQAQAAEEMDLAAMFESGQVKIKGTAGILKHRPRAAGGPRKPRRSPGGGFSSYEDAMNQAIELGDVSKGGGERQLGTSDIQGVMDRKLNSLFGCVSKELRAGRRLGDVRIDMAILGSGQVAGASVNTGSAAFKGCIAAKVKQIKFPSFPAPRMGARYTFGVD